MADMNITSGGTYKLEKNFTGTITIATSSAVTLDGTNASNLSNVKIITSSNNADLTIKNLNATNESGNVIKFGSGTGNKLTLIGTNKLKTSDIWAAVVHVGGGLTINGTGSLDVIPGTQGSGIGANSYATSNANITINGGKITATSDLGAGIGSGSNGSIGNITINAVSINATSNWGKGIGAGLSGSAGKVSITIVGDTGDDILIGTSGTDTFAYTGGNDVITNYSHEDTVHIKSGKINSYSFDGSDLIFNIGNGSLRLNNMTNHAITVTDSLGNTTTKIYGTGYSGHEVMKRFVHSMANSKLDTKLRVDEAIRACSHFNSLSEVINQLTNDLNTAGDAETFLKKYCGIFKENADTGAVTGWDAGGLHAKTTNELLPTNYSNIYPASTSFTKRGLTLTVPAKNTLTSDEQLVVQKIYSADMEDSLKLIEETYGFKFTDKPLTIPLYIVHQPGDAPAWAGVGGITVNLSNGGDNPAYYLTHELTHVAQQHFGFFDHMPNFMFEGMADLTAGGDVRGSLELASNPSKLAKYLKDTSDNDPYTSGVIFWRYLMRQATDSYNSSKSYTWKDNAYIGGTASSEFLTGSGKNMTLSAGAGNDTLTVYGEKMKALGDGGNDYILISSLASNASIDGGLGNDTIRNEGVHVMIMGGTGKDSIENEDANVTIDGGSDDDQIKSHSDNVKVMGGDGNDTLLVEKTSNYNWDKSVWEDTYHDKATIDGGAGNDFIKNENSNSSIYASAGNDTVENHADNVRIQGETGKNLLINGEFFGRGGVKVTILGGADDDTITSSGSNSVLDGGTGNDLIHNGYYYYRDWNAYYEASYNNEHDDRLRSSNVTITGGKGNDTIKNHSNNILFQYALGDGDDYIEGFNATSTLNISGGTYTKQTSGDAVIVTVGNGKITLSGAASLSKLNISNKNTIDTTNGGSTSSTLMTVTNNTKSPVTIGSAIKTVNASSRTSAVKITGNSLANSIVGGSAADTLWGATGNDTLTGGSGNDVFIYSAGKDVITDYASGDKISLGAAVSKTSLSGSDVVFTIGTGSLTVKNAKGKTISGFDKSSKSFSTILGGSTTSTLLTVTNSTKSPVTIGSAIKTVNASSRTSAVKITGNVLANSIIGGKGADTLWGGTGNDTLTGGSGNDVFIYSAGKDVITDYASGDKISLGAAVSKTSLSGSDVVFTIGTGSLTVKNAKGKTISGFDKSGKSFSTILGGSTTSTLLTVTNSTKSPVTIGSAIKTVNASSRTSAVKITGNALANSIIGGKGADTLWGGTGNDTLTGGSGNDVFIYSAGKDVITDYAASDKISLGAAVSKATVSGSDVVFTVGSGSLTVKNAKGKSLSMIDKSGKAYTTIVGGSTSSTLMTVTNTTKSPVTIDSAVKTVDASARIIAVKITGNSEPNTILGGAENDTLLGNSGADYLNGLYGDDKLYGSSGNDTLIGNSGNDSLWGEGGNDTFIYGDGDGKDVIVGFESNDLLKITGTFSATYNPLERNVSFKVGSTANAITLKDFTATSFNINGNVYQISGSKLVKK